MSDDPMDEVEGDDSVMQMQTPAVTQSDGLSTISAVNDEDNNENNENASDIESEENDDSDNDDEMVVDDNANDDAHANIDFTQPYVPKKIKKPCSAWIIYSTENREKIKELNPGYGFKEMAGALSAGFKNMSDDERAVYTAKAQEQKDKYALELAEQERMIALYKSQPGANMATAEKTFQLTTELIFPLARIRRTMKLDPEVKNIKPEAATAVGKTLELFLAFMAVRVGQIAATHKRRTVTRADLVELIHRHPAVTFLKGDFPQKNNSNRKSIKTHDKKPTHSQIAATKAAAGSSKITGFFHKNGHSTQTPSTVVTVDNDDNNDDNNIEE